MRRVRVQTKPEIVAHGSAILRGKTLDLLKDTLNLMSISLGYNNSLEFLDATKIPQTLITLELKGQIKNNCSRTWEN